MQNMNKKIMIIGAGGHGKVVADIAKKNGYSQIAFLDDNASDSHFSGYPVLGNSKCAIKYSDWDFVVAIGNAETRQRIQEQLQNNHLCTVSVIHPQAVIAEDVEIGEGTVIMAGAVVNPGAKLGKGCIINTCSSVDHDCCLGDYVHVSVGAHIAGDVKIGKHTWIGIGASVSNRIEITQECMIGAGAVVVKDIIESGTYIGVPAKKTENRK